MVAKRTKSIDVSDSPDLTRVAEEVRAGAEPLVLRRGGEALAVVTPIPASHRGPTGAGPKPVRRRRREITEEDLEAFRAAAGAWADVDTDKLLEDIYASRDASVRAPVDL